VYSIRIKIKQETDKWSQMQGKCDKNGIFWQIEIIRNPVLQLEKKVNSYA
jgi:hypothetical protein